MPQPAPDSKSGRPRAYSYSVDDATDSFGTFGQVELEADQIMCLERIGEYEWSVIGSAV